MGLRELSEWCDKLIAAGEGFSVEDKELFMAEIMVGYEGVEVARLLDRTISPKRRAEPRPKRKLELRQTKDRLANVPALSSRLRAELAGWYQRRHLTAMSLSAASWH